MNENNNENQNIKVVYDESLKEKKKILTPSSSPKIKRKRIITISAVSAFALILGVGGGMLMSNLLKPVPDVKGETASAKKTNDALFTQYHNEVESVVEKYNTYKIENSEIANEDLSQSFEPRELVQLSMHLFSNQNSYKTVSVGSADIQKIYNCTIKNGDKYFEESISTSMFVNIARRMYQEGESVETYDHGAIDGEAAAKFNETDKKTIPLEEYKNDRGRCPSICGVYLISSDTINNVTKNVRNADGTYDIELDMEPTKSTCMYRVQMQEISNLRGLPKFKSVHLSYKLDKDLMPISMNVKERYYANVNALISNKKIESELDTHFYSGEEWQIPELNTPIKY